MHYLVRLASRRETAEISSSVSGHDWETIGPQLLPLVGQASIMTHYTSETMQLTSTIGMQYRNANNFLGYHLGNYAVFI
jgi:hypothetical protein